MKNIILILLVVLSSCQFTKPKKETCNLNEEVAAPADYMIPVEENIIPDEPSIDDTLCYIRSGYDGYWDRKCIFQSKNEHEHLMNVKVCPDPKGYRFYFFGCDSSANQNNTDVLLYELYEDGHYHIIDVINGLNRDYTNTKMGVLDNLIIRGDKLYYHNGVAGWMRDSIKQMTLSRTYFEYEMGSGKAPKPCSETYATFVDQRLSSYIYQQYLLSPNKEWLAINTIFDIEFIKNTDPQSITNHLIEIEPLKNLKPDLNLLPFFPYTNGNENIVPTFAGMCWHPDNKKIFFDNTDDEAFYACIWIFNVETHAIKKIIPEHQAIHPEYFSRNNQDMLAYTFKNQLMIARPNNPEHIYGYKPASNNNNDTCNLISILKRQKLNYNVSEEQSNDDYSHTTHYDISNVNLFSFHQLLYNQKFCCGQDAFLLKTIPHYEIVLNHQWPNVTVTPTFNFNEMTAITYDYNYEGGSTQLKMATVPGGLEITITYNPD